MLISETVSVCPAAPPRVSPRVISTERHWIEIVGSSAAMRCLRTQVRRIGPHFRTVLISGEPGTGKDLVARTLHRMRRGTCGPLVVCHAAEFGDVLECRTEVKFADAFVRLMRLLEPGTLLLDQVSEMNLESQNRLLRALRKHEQTQGRSEMSRLMDVRLIATTRVNLKTLVSTGRFRQELYQRLATVEIAVPPLREHLEDVPELASGLMKRFARLHGTEVTEISGEAMERLQRHHWPANVRDLENVLRDAMLRCDRRLLASHLPEFAGTADAPASARSASLRLQDVVDQHVLRVLNDCGGNKLRAAETLGISRSTLYRMLEAGVSSDGWKQSAKKKSVAA